MQNKPTVLVVEDDEDLQQALSEMLGDLGFAVVMASDGHQALEALSNHNISLILSDIEMPRLNGVSLLQALRGKGSDIPVILMTGYTDYLNINLGRRGAVALLEKPFSRSKIEKVLQPFLQAGLLRMPAA